MEKSTYLTFVLGKEYFAVNVDQVLEVLQHQQITKVPKTPEHILGIINFRGDILPVVDTRKKFNLELQDDNQRSITIVFDIHNEEQRVLIAATADAVKDVIEVEPDEIKPVPEMGISYNTKFISGAIRRDEVFIMMLNVEKVFSVGDLALVQQLSESSALME
ncbi:purine-binding chemotaxis protein CheW [Breznakibacter xylanolyticus]|uniref:Purine-binding chemotaxis protein CheW n=1 Tax=Breznakibacter xylanolyticus TaxID=990 RepID=A0A2W7NAN2_9BACT|nr:chemotaxis protein CheW [Breznakibacter xylanolyticus]PZX15147.1 purine-binding chemotaxis protein CheW [Breznakibacter xylanolyticus]